MTVVVVGAEKAPASEKTIWVLTCMMIHPGTNRAERQRTWGWFEDFKYAEECVLSNATDIYEMGYYNTVVLEEMISGPMAYAKSEVWYSATHTLVEQSLGSYDVKRIEKPKCLEGICSFGMG